MNKRTALDHGLRWAGLGAVMLGLSIVVLLVGTVVVRGVPALDLGFLWGADSIDAARVGIGGALKGSLMTLAVTLGLALPLGVGTAIWLAEFAPRRRWTALLDALIANLAAVPPILFGLLGLGVFIGAAHLPRSSSLVAGLVLTLMTAPVVATASLGALRAVPSAIRDAARGVGASPVQVAFHHVLPLAAPGIVTGALLGTARALGEVAPLLLIGMNAFIAAPPADLSAPATTLSMQAFLWSDRLGNGFVERTAGATLVLLAVLLLLTGTAAWVRHRWEQRL